MKTGVSVLTDFIRDFKLEVPGVGVWFDADIEFTTATLHKKFKSEVHIVTMAMKQLSVLYLLHKDLAEYGIPDTFQFDPESFFYHKKECLTIIDYDLLRGKFTLVISPLNVKYGVLQPNDVQSR